MKRIYADQCKENFVILFSNTVIEPNTVMVEAWNTAITGATVLAT